MHLLAAVTRAGCKSRAALQLENLALRHQHGVLHRSVKRPRLTAADRLLWAWLCGVWRLLRDRDGIFGRSRAEEGHAIRARPLLHRTYSTPKSRLAPAGAGVLPRTEFAIATVEQILAPAWSFDCPICRGIKALVCQIVEENLDDRRVQLSRAACLECGLVIPTGTPFLADAL